MNNAVVTAYPRRKFSTVGVHQALKGKVHWARLQNVKGRWVWSAACYFRRAMYGRLLPENDTTPITCQMCREKWGMK
jgi:hypothetical protein